MSFLAANFLGLIGLVGLFHVTGWLLDQVVMEGRGLEPVAAVGRSGLGAAVWMGWVFVLATLQRLSAPALGLVAILTIMAVWRQRRSVSGSFLAAPGPVTDATRDPLAWLLGSAVAAVLVGLWLQALWPQVSWDSNAYHLTVPRLYLEHGGFRRIPFNVYSNWPLNAQLLFAMAMAARDYLLAKSLHFAFGLATVLLVHRVVALENRSRAGWLAGALLLVNPVVLDEFRAAYVDLTFAFFFFLAFVLLNNMLESGVNQGRRLIVAGVLCGVAAGIKPTGLMAVGCLLIFFLVVSLRQGRQLGQVAKGLARIVVPAGLVLAPWAIKSWILTGNPVYPFLYPQLGGPEWSTALGDQLKEWMQGIGMGRTGLDYLLLPTRVLVEGGPSYENFGGRVSPVWLILVPMALVLGRGKPWIVRSLGVAGLYFGFWALSSQQMRFLIPVLPFLAVAGALGLVELFRRLPTVAQPALEWGVSLAVIATLGIATSTMVEPTWRMLGRYLEAGEAVKEEAVHPVFRFIDEQLPREARLMFLNTNHGFFCHREFVADSFFEASQINDLLRSKDGKGGIRETLDELGITHLLIENRDRNVPWPRSLSEFLADPQLAQRVYRAPDSRYDVVEIVGASRQLDP